MREAAERSAQFIGALMICAREKQRIATHTPASRNARTIRTVTRFFERWAPTPLHRLPVLGLLVLAALVAF